MGRRQPIVVVMVLGAVFAAVPGHAQEEAQEPAPYREVESPFQEGFSYTVGEVLRPRVDVAGVRWRSIVVDVRGDREIEADKELPVIIESSMESLRDDRAEVVVILLFENAQSMPLHRIELPTFRIRGGREERIRERYRISGQVLLDTERLYLFCEVR